MQKRGIFNAYPSDMRLFCAAVLAAGFVGVVMRIVEYAGQPVRRQRKLDQNKILICFYNRAPLVVTPAEWVKNSQNKYFPDTLSRKDVVKNYAHH